MEAYLGTAISLLRCMTPNPIAISSIIYRYLIVNNHIIFEVVQLHAFFSLNVSLRLIISSLFTESQLAKRYSS